MEDLITGPIVTSTEPAELTLPGAVTALTSKTESIVELPVRVLPLHHQEHQDPLLDIRARALDQEVEGLVNNFFNQP